MSVPAPASGEKNPILEILEVFFVVCIEVPILNFFFSEGCEPFIKVSYLTSSPSEIYHVLPTDPALNKRMAVSAFDFRQRLRVVRVKPNLQVSCVLDVNILIAVVTFYVSNISHGH